jgi:two-component system, NarL family, sensor histidine kinase DesK
MQPRLRRARLVTLGALVANGAAALILPAIGLSHEPSILGAAAILGVVGILVFCAAQAYVLHALVTPWADQRPPAIVFAVASVASLPLVAPVGGPWPSWSWLAACIVGVIPVLMFGRWRWAMVVVVVVIAVVVASDEAWHTLLITGGFGLGLAAVNALQLWYWDVLLEIDEGRLAESQLAAAEERLRIARDVHDLLGHRLSVIALKAELAERLTLVDAVRAQIEASEVREIAASALVELREAVYEYRRIDLAGQLTAIEQILESSGVRCTVNSPGDVPEHATPLLSAVLREATTNLLRHSEAVWCTVDVAVTPSFIRLIVANDGAGLTHGDARSSGLRGLADRLAEADGSVHTHQDDGTFTVEAVIPSNA